MDCRVDADAIVASHLGRDVGGLKLLDWESTRDHRIAARF